MSAARGALFYLAVLLIPAEAVADPFIDATGFIQTGAVGQGCSICLPPADLSFSGKLITPSFVTTSTSGGGSVNASAPFFPSSTAADGSYSFRAGGSVTTIGPGTASVHFGESVLLNITNIGSSSGSIVYPELSLGFLGGYSAHPDQGQSLFVSASIPFDGALPSGDYLLCAI